MFVLVTDATEEPVTWEQLQAQCRIDANDEQVYGESLIVAARQLVEARLRRALVTQTWRLNLDCFPDWAIEINKPRLIAVTHVKYKEVSDGTLTTLDSGDYTIDADSEPGRIMPAYGLSWPGVYDEVNAVQVTFTAGYGDADVVPQSIKQAVLLLASHWFANREPVNIGNITSLLPMGVDSLLATEAWGSYP